MTCKNIGVFTAIFYTDFTDGKTGSKTYDVRRKNAIHRLIFVIHFWISVKKRFFNDERIDDLLKQNIHLGNHDLSPSNSVNCSYAMVVSLC